MLGGGVPEEQSVGKGWFVKPTIFADVNNKMRIAQEEVFGPVMAIIPFRDENDAVSIANDSIYGLAGAVWSNNINTAHKVAAAVRVGTMGINNYFGGDVTVPFGGFKQSGWGREKGPYGLDLFTSPGRGGARRRHRCDV